MKFSLRFLFISLILSLAGLGAVSAQSKPLYIVMGGDLYTWSGDANSSVTLDATCDSSEVVLSGIEVANDGKIAFLSEPPSVTELTSNETFGIGGPLPSNVNICDGSNLNMIAGQPDNFSFMAGDVPDVAVTRGIPSWSPDGSKLAWTSLELDGSVKLNIYDVAGASTVSASLTLPEFAGPPAPPYLTWKNNGIYLYHSTLDAETFAYLDFVFLYDASGAEISSVQLPPSDESRFVYDKFIATDNGQEMIALLYNDGIWELVDPMTGNAQPAGGVGEMYSLANPTGISLVLILDETQQYVWKAKNEFGIILDVNGNEVAVPGVFPPGNALSDAGQWAIHLYDGLYYWSMTASGFISGSEGVVGGFSSIAWSPIGWRIFRAG